MADTADKRYSDGEYLAANPTWGEEDSAWKGRKIPALWQRSGLPVPASVAEIGCGAGLILATLEQNFPDTVTYAGFDIAAAAIEMAHRHAGARLSYHCEDLTKSNRRFDAL